MLSDPAVTRHLAIDAPSREESWRKMLAGAGLWAFLGYGYWVIEGKEDGVFYGQVGFADFKRALHPSIEGIPEIGWMLTTGAQRHGHAFEAASAALHWADGYLDCAQTAAIIDPGNARSIRLAERLGFRADAESPYRDGNVILFSRPRGSPSAAAAATTTAS